MMYEMKINEILNEGCFLLEYESASYRKLYGDDIMELFW